MRCDVPFAIPKPANGSTSCPANPQSGIQKFGTPQQPLKTADGNVADSPVTIEIVTERAVLLIRGDLTVSHADGRIETVTEPVASTGGRAYWGASHERLIADFYRRLADPDPFWISPQEGARSLRVIQQIYDRNS